VARAKTIQRNTRNVARVTDEGLEIRSVRTAFSIAHSYKNKETLPKNKKVL
jgi:hypothetical protein